jgi:hypothetical protein
VTQFEHSRNGDSNPTLAHVSPKTFWQTISPCT